MLVDEEDERHDLLGTCELMLEAILMVIEVG
jgi:hypothetical protein